MLGRRLTASTSLMLLVLVSMIMAIAVMFYNVWSAWQQEVRGVTTQVVQVAELSVARQKSITQTTQMLLTSLAVSPLAQQGNELSLHRFLTDLLREDPIYYGFWIFELDGSCPVFAVRDKSSPPPPEVVRARPSFQEALSTQHFSVGRLFYSNKVPTLPMTTPIFNAKGTLVRIVMAMLDLRQYDAYFQSLAQSTGSTLMLVDMDKTRLYHSPHLEGITIGTSIVTPALIRTIEENKALDFFEAVDPVGRQRLFTVEKIQYPSADPNAPPYAYAIAITDKPDFRSFLKDHYMFELIAIIGSLFFALLVARTTGYLLFTKGLQRMAFVAQNSFANQLSLRNNTVTGCKEIQTVAYAYDAMLDTLGAYTAELREKRERLDMALHAANLGTWVWNQKTFALDLDRRSAEILGYTPENIPVHTLQDLQSLIHPDDQFNFYQHLHSPHPAQTSYQCEARFQHAHGHWVWLLLLGHSPVQTMRLSLPAEAGSQKKTAPSDMFGICMDITLRKQAEELLRQNSEHYRTLSNTDPLTGLWNRRYCEERAAEEIQRAIRYQRPLSLCMCDLDHFKRVNDSYGHHVGDAVLKHFTHIMQDNLRTTDGVARYGGEEFTLLLPECKAAGAILTLEKIRLAFESAPLIIQDTIIPCTVSCGFCSVECWQTDSPWGNTESLAHKTPFAVPADNDAKQVFRILLKQADAALYQAKETGRNKVVQWQEPGADS